MEKRERPDFCSDAHLGYLDALRESGVTNMFGAAPYLLRAFKKELKDDARAGKVLLYWISSFSERHPK